MVILVCSASEVFYATVKIMICWGDLWCTPMSEVMLFCSISKMNGVCVCVCVNNGCVWKVSALHPSAVNRSRLNLHVTQSQGFSSWILGSYMWGKSCICPTSASSSADWSVLSRWCRSLWRALAALFLCCDCLDVLMMTAGGSSIHLCFLLEEVKLYWQTAC